MSNIRPSICAGSFFPETEEELKKTIEKLLNDAKLEEIPGFTKALILPHAGYEYSGMVAAAGYKALQAEETKFENVVIIGPSHRVMFPNIALTNFVFWRTPLGLVHLHNLSREIVDDYTFKLVNEAHAFDHSIEVQLPFLQTVLSDFEITPMLTGRVSSIREIVETLNEHLNKKTLIIVSTDLCHYLPYNEASENDQETIKQILDLEELDGHEQACGLSGINILIELAKMNKWKAKLLDYKNSGDTAGDKEQVVGYTSIAFYK